MPQRDPGATSTCCHVLKNIGEHLSRFPVCFATFHEHQAHDEGSALAVYAHIPALMDRCVCIVFYKQMVRFVVNPSSWCHVAQVAVVWFEAT